MPHDSDPRRPLLRETVTVTTPPAAPGDRTLRVLLILLALIPIGTGTFGVITGLSIGPGGAADRADYFDTEYRFLSGVWLGIGISLIWAAMNIQQRRQVVSVALIAIGLGAVSRLVGAIITGLPPLPFAVAFLIEATYVPIVALLFIRSARRGQ